MVPTMSPRATRLVATVAATAENEAPRVADPSAPGCTWHGEDGSVGIGWLTDNKGGLSDPYRRRELDVYFVAAAALAMVKEAA